ncbi:aminotransferase class V-fold PLP-dependent enzyme [Tautonia sociabilis]|uniref:Aminotransferase class V-fold PLP-dependent enzyme n=1 Tax=Tautonia sociabilis TaxID=2080755 RepID=A0A432ME21_9BACT|nr:aminotransferase class V-fold PLP-dependent enzyme [Tautonia sociabilis]RUL83398.1 aminotransferase class V-fold PLP-dependent enzyme [Tautonia sociabilis]
MDWQAIRDEEFPVAGRWAYLDHAAIAPIPRRAGDAMRAWIAEQEANGCIHWMTWRNELEVVRRRAAALIHAEPAEVAFITSTTMGIGLVAEGFPWNDGDNLVTAAEEYPSNLFPWMNLSSRGVETRLVRSRDGRLWLEDLLEAMDGRTRLLAISHVEFASGFRNDLDRLTELCHERGVALFVDAIQGLGPLTIDVRKTPIDFLAADGHKWLLGPEGAGLLFVRKDWIDRLRPILVGSNSATSSYNDPEPAFTLRSDAGRWEGGCYNMAGLLGFGKSLELILDVGADRVSARILDRAEGVRERARSAGWRVVGSDRPGDRSGIVVLDRDGSDNDAVARRLRESGVAVSCRRKKLRVSPHLYNNDDDLDRLAEGLRAPS